VQIKRERRELVQLIGERPRNCRVFCVGVGNEVNRPLLQQLAEDSGGLAAFISQSDDFARQAKAFRRKLTRPVATAHATRLFSTVSNRMRGETPYTVPLRMKTGAKLSVARARKACSLSTFEIA